jgi:hypothetical protein
MFRKSGTLTRTCPVLLPVLRRPSDVMLRRQRGHMRDTTEGWRVAACGLQVAGLLILPTGPLIHHFGCKNSG